MTIIVKVSDQLVKRFTDDHLATYEKCVPTEAWPTLFGDELDSRLKYTGVKLVDIADIDLGTWDFQQKSRAGAKNPKYKEIRRNIRRNGFKLIYPAISLLMVNGRYYIITGNTRLEILKDLGMENVICAIYEPNSSNPKEVGDAVSQAGLLFNTIHDEASTTQTDDVKREVEHAIEQEWIEPTLADITDRVETVCGNGVFGETTRLQLIYEILNNHNPDRQVFSWTNKSFTNNWLKTSKLVNGNGIKYLLWTTENKPKVFIRALEEAAKFSGEVRVLLHTGTLSGYDLEQCYNDRVQDFLDFWTATLSNIQSCYGVKIAPSQSNIKLYGVLPSLSDIHDMDKLVFIDDDGSLFQKISDENGETTKHVVYS